MRTFADRMINVPSLIQLKAFARIDGLWLALLWTTSFLSMMYVPKSALGGLLMLATPPFMLWRFIKFRNYALDGVISFARGLAYGCYCIFYASLLFALVQTAYFQFLDGGHFVQIMHQALQTMEGVYQQNGVDIKQAMETVDLMSTLKPIELAFVFMTQNLLLGALLSVIVAAIGMKRVKNHTRI